MSTALIGLAGAAITGFIGLITHLITARTERQKTVGEQYQGLVDEVKEWANERLAERDAQIKELRADQGAMRQDISNLRDVVRELQHKYRAAISHIGDLRRYHPNPPPIPPDIIEDVR